MKNEPPANTAIIQLDRRSAQYEPGEALSATASVTRSADDGLRSVELSIVWYTAGKGDEDLHVHEFQRTAAPSPEVGQTLELTVETELPTSPLSYAGFIVKVCWAVRMRLFYAAGRERLVEAPLELGVVDAPQPTADAAAAEGARQ